ncbi:hypothetical protein CLV54_0119 [Compostimonas suwonensis]|uniref:Glycoside hydrolase family 127 protein n=2 Tax=Compostimonas suwonensis TaxID=1048394 RepID=A0A2M9C3K7_9MICO|nr:hypothetical protein CLV54_0119 [Compostimonas suwonensis]
MAVHHTLDVRSVRLTSGPMADWQALNAAATIPHCIVQLEPSGVLANFRRAAGEETGGHQGMVFADSDLYKVIEAVAWEIARTGTRRFDLWLDEVIALIGRAQEPSGYLHTWTQLRQPEKKWAEMEWTHELYVLGHLIQAAVALDRAAGRSDLLEIAQRFADLVWDEFGPDGRDGICGHPEIETALVELHRHTGDDRYLILAGRMIDLRGHGLLPVGLLGAKYFQDHTPVRESDSAAGHAVRQLYLNAGATDVYLETGDASLLTAMDAQWDSVHDRKMYLSGAFGAHHKDEGFGEDYELPSDRAYAETCATIADLHWAWRMLLAGGSAGPAAYASVMEREVHNALAASIDATGTRFFYANPLQQRPDKVSEDAAPRERAPWYPCACCPPNIARAVAQFGAYVASSTADTLWLHQLAGAEIDLPAHLGTGVLRVATGYPLTAGIELVVDGAPAPGAILAVRIPEWSAGSLLVAPDGEHAVDADGYARAPLVAGGRYRLDLDLTPRLIRAHHRVDALRGTLALQRGPVVYCVEQADLPAGPAVDDLILLPDEGIGSNADGTLTLTCTVASEEPLYTANGEAVHTSASPVTAVPFATWGNRAPGAMRVWLPAHWWETRQIADGQLFAEIARPNKPKEAQ